MLSKQPCCVLCCGLWLWWWWVELDIHWSHTCILLTLREGVSVVMRSTTAHSTADIAILVAPCFKNLLRLEAGYPALRCHNLNNQQVTRTQHTRDKNKDDTGNSKTAKHSHTHKTHSRNDERQRLSSCCQSCRRRPRDHRRWFDARRAAEGGDVVGLTVRSMVTVATRRPPRQPAMRPTQAHLLTLSLLPTRGTGHPLRENELYRSS